jgi:tRNA (cytidine/uridine-2'-O-)-methyltransferase
MLPDAASLDDAPLWRARHDAALARAAGAAAEAPRDICGNFVPRADAGISSLNLSNAAAVVIYEALRQTGFAGMGQEGL